MTQRDDERANGPAEEGAPLPYRAARDDRDEWWSEHSKAFKKQMAAGITVGLAAIFLWVGLNVVTEGKVIQACSILFGGGVLVWTAVSVIEHRTGGFVVGLVLSVVVALMITGCGLAVICGAIGK